MVYVEDLIRAGDLYFKKMARKTAERFEMAEDQSIPCVFTGFSILQGSNGEVVQDQHGYLKKLEELLVYESYTTIRSMLIKLAWVAETRPDCIFKILQLAHVTEELFEK